MFNSLGIETTGAWMAPAVASATMYFRARFWLVLRCNWNMTGVGSRRTYRFRESTALIEIFIHR